MLSAGWEAKEQCPLKGVEGGLLDSDSYIHAEVRDSDGGNGMVSWRVIARAMVPNPVSLRDQGLRAAVVHRKRRDQRGRHTAGNRAGKSPVLKS